MSWRSALSLLVTLALSGCQQKADVSNDAEATATSQEVSDDRASQSYTYTVYRIEPGEVNADEGFGFEISGKDEGSFKVRQNQIPAVQGNHPFISEEDAASTAKLMIAKLEKGILPPAISIEELDSIGVVY